jgi:hypothetical protein
MKNKKSAVAVGNRFEMHLVAELKERLDSGTKLAYRSGAGLDKQDIIIPSFKIEIEAKNQKTLKIIDWWEQCKRQEFGNTGVLILRNPRKPEFAESLVVMGMDDWIELVKKQNEVVEVESNFDPNLKWKVKRLKDAAGEVFKELQGR